MLPISCKALHFNGNHNISHFFGMKIFPCWHAVRSVSLNVCHLTAHIAIFKILTYSASDRAVVFIILTYRHFLCSRSGLLQRLPAKCADASHVDRLPSKKPETREHIRGDILKQLAQNFHNPQEDNTQIPNSISARLQKIQRPQRHRCHLFHQSLRWSREIPGHDPLQKANAAPTRLEAQLSCLCHLSHVAFSPNQSSQPMSQTQACLNVSQPILELVRRDLAEVAEIVAKRLLHREDSFAGPIAAFELALRTPPHLILAPPDDFARLALGVRALDGSACVRPAAAHTSALFPVNLCVDERSGSHISTFPIEVHVLGDPHAKRR
mmetsp:Transcript_107681/g.202354  ORF Transcript_107681/g.202354 Transcript_107681/m.202354 type:complete len:324 (+) Transcript_107681:49-1020(+)